MELAVGRVDVVAHLQATDAYTLRYRSAMRSASVTHTSSPGSPKAATMRSALVKSSPAVYVDIVTRHAI